MQAYNPGTQEAKAGYTQGYPWLYNNFQGSLGYMYPYSTTRTTIALTKNNLGPWQHPVKEDRCPAGDAQQLRALPGQLTINQL